MAITKSYTDIPQGLKLEEVLPLESADMHYVRMYFEGNESDWFVKLGRPVKSDDIIPCWSLAVLINVLPRSIEFKGDKYYLRFMKEYVEYANDEVSITGRCLHTTGNNNLVDACVDMIEKLHKRKIL